MYVPFRPKIQRHCIARNPYLRVRMSTIDLLVLTSSEQLLFILLFLVYKTRRSTVLSLPSPSEIVP